ncbi:MAG: hypothetical protein AAB817_00885 [Patescibacteria group bacterium]
MLDRDLAIAILKTMAYFDLFDYPLVSTEIWRYLFAPESSPVSLAEIDTVVNHPPGWLARTDGHYYLAQAPAELVTRRQQRWRDSQAKWRRARRVGRWLAYLPFVRLIAVANTVSYHAATPTSDIDLFIITAPDHIWTARAACLTLLAVFGLRPGQRGKQANQVCLSFFIDTDHLNLEPTALPRTDIHFVYWLEQLYPIYDAGGVGQKFFQANNWLNSWLPNRAYQPPHPRWSINLTGIERLIKRLGEQLFGPAWLERWCQWRSRKALPPVLRDKMNRDVGVIVGAGIVKLIANDRREGYRNEWVIKVNDLLKRYYG